MVFGMSQAETLAAIVVLFVVELNHLKWIWWTQWTCRACGHRNRDCPCSDKWKWMVYL
jgi:C4-type Zn-finger protein